MAKANGSSSKDEQIKELTAKLEILSKKLDLQEQKSDDVIRNEKRGQMIWHDLFELEVTKTRKNVSYHEEEEKAIWVDVPHKHYYHTYDSRGRKLDKCAPGAGHFHEIKVSEVEVKDDEGNIKKVLKAECSPPMVMSKGRKVPYKNDKHVHSVKYITSEQIEMRVVNQEAAKMMNYLASAERKAQRDTAGFVR